MKMREYYRWEKRLPFGARLPNEDVGAWLTEREQRWESVGSDEFRPIPVGDQAYDPFDAGGINRALDSENLVYSGGLGHKGRPHFFLGRRERAEHRGGTTILVCGEEFARDLTAPPAMMREDVVYVRREALRRMLWEKLETWRWSRPQNALWRAFSAYGLDGDGDVTKPLDRMTDSELDPVLWHELGEQEAGALLGDSWEEMLLALACTPGELVARAVRDHLADCLSTIPALAAGARHASIHFFRGNLTAMRKELFPSLGKAYDAWLESNDYGVLAEVARSGEVHWRSVAEQLLDAWSTHPESVADAAQRIGEARRL